MGVQKPTSSTAATGSDTLDGGAGADRLIGGFGFDFASYVGAAAGVTVSLTMQHANAGDAAGDELFSIEALIGSNFGDKLYGDDMSNRFHGGGGNDEMHAWAGDDALYGGDGDDRIVGGAGADYVFGDTGIDTADYYTAATGVVVDLTNRARNTGDAKGDSYQSIENLAGSKFDDNLTADNNANAIHGYSGNDMLHGLLGNDTLEGDGGDDILIGGAGADRLIGGAGLGDMVAYNAVNGMGVTVHLAKPQHNSGEAAGDTYDGIENVAGTQYTDTLVGDAKNNMLYGLGSDDILRGGLGADVLVGGEGFDWASYADAVSGVRVDLVNRSVNTGEAAGDSYSETEALQGSSYGDQLAGNEIGNALSGLAGNDVLQGRGGNDHLDGGAGDDILNGGAGGDVLIGGLGFDWASYIDAAAGVTADLASHSGNTGEAAGDSYSGIEALQGSNHGDALGGDAIGNALFGLGGNDSLQGRGGNDHLDGGTGDDILHGGIGADVLDGGADFDWASYATATAGVIASLLNSATNTGEAAGDSYVGIEALQGSNYNDVLTAADYLAGNALVGLGGNDVLFGRIGNDYLEGGEGNDALYGQTGADVLTGGNGDDTLAGGANADQLTGGAGGDRFVFDTILGNGNIDRIADFMVGQDVMALSRDVFGSFISSGALSSAALTAGASATSAHHRLVYNSATGALSYDADGLGGAAQVQFATLNPNLALNTSSFVLI
ncbi:Ca2+-binding RTX toxin-like protein [Microvirga lupini]|uniref:Ca2+-binding RTX toxin-like protein n=1 Tax=Microvirga lupini TaxID=420324 RepID=A0A7W4YWS5_9HYPH|nr:calcium-binding protein [Microvirga lupini]MBB3019822.1 Ca2+-binding RTX toxin-like protein [Microvirga lupini]